MALALTLPRAKRQRNSLKKKKDDFNSVISNAQKFGKKNTQYKDIKNLIDQYYQKAAEDCITLSNRLEAESAAEPPVSPAILKEYQDFLDDYSTYLETIVSAIEKQTITHWGRNKNLLDNLQWLTGLEAKDATQFHLTTHDKTVSSITRFNTWLTKQINDVAAKAKTAASAPKAKKATSANAKGTPDGGWYGNGRKDKLKVNKAFNDQVQLFRDYWTKNLSQILAGKHPENVAALQSYFESALDAINMNHLHDLLIPGRSPTQEINQVFAFENSNNYDDHFGFTGPDGKVLNGYNQYKTIMGGELCPDEENPEPPFSNLARQPKASGKLKGGASRQRISTYKYTDVEAELQYLVTSLSLPRGSRQDIRIYEGKEEPPDDTESPLAHFIARIGSMDTPILLLGNEPAENSTLRTETRKVFGKIPGLASDFDDLDGFGVKKLVDEMNKLKSSQKTSLYNVWDRFYLATSVSAARGTREWDIDGRRFDASDFPRKLNSKFSAAFSDVTELWYRQLRLLAILERLFEKDLASEADILEAESDRLQYLSIHQKIFNLWDLAHFNMHLETSRSSTKAINRHRRARRTELMGVWGGRMQSIKRILDDPTRGQALRAKAADPSTAKKSAKADKTKETEKAPKSKATAATTSDKTATGASAQSAERLQVITDLRERQAALRADAVQRRDNLDPNDPGDRPAWRYFNENVRVSNLTIWGLDEQIKNIKAGKWEPSVPAGTKRPFPYAPNEVMDQYVVQPLPPKKRRLVEGIDLKGAGPSPGERSTPSVPRVLVGNNSSTGRIAPPPLEPREFPPFTPPIITMPNDNDPPSNKGKDTTTTTTTTTAKDNKTKKDSRGKLVKPPTKKKATDTALPTTKPKVTNPLELPGISGFLVPSTSSSERRSRTSLTPLQEAINAAAAAQRAAVRARKRADERNTAVDTKAAVIAEEKARKAQDQVEALQMVDSQANVDEIRKQADDARAAAASEAAQKAVKALAATDPAPQVKAAHERVKEAKAATDAAQAAADANKTVSNLYAAADAARTLADASTLLAGLENTPANNQNLRDAQNKARDTYAAWSVVNAAADAASSATQQRAKDARVGLEQAVAAAEAYLTTRRGSTGSDASSDGQSEDKSKADPNAKPGDDPLDGWPSVKMMMRQMAIAVRAQQPAQTQKPARTTARRRIPVDTSEGPVFWARPNSDQSRIVERARMQTAQEWFPNGREVLNTSGSGLLCALWAIMLSMRMQHPDISPQPTALGLLELLKTDPLLLALKHNLDSEVLKDPSARRHGGTRNLLIDQAAALFLAWARKHKMNFVIGCMIEPHPDDTNPGPPREFFADGTEDTWARKIYVEFEGPISPDKNTRYVYIQHNNNGHYSGMAPIGDAKYASAAGRAERMRRAYADVEQAERAYHGTQASSSRTRRGPRRFRKQAIMAGEPEMEETLEEYLFGRMAVSSPVDVESDEEMGGVNDASEGSESEVSEEDGTA